MSLGLFLLSAVCVFFLGFAIRTLLEDDPEFPRSREDRDLIRAGADVLTVMVAVVAVLLLAGGLYYKTSKDAVNRFFEVEEVLTRLPAKGEGTFHAKFLLTYEDGRLESASFVDGTIKPADTIK